MATGPVQALVIGFEEGKFKGEVLAELARLEKHDVVRLLDLLLVRKDAVGNVEVVNVDESAITDLSVSGDVAKALLGNSELAEEAGETEAGETEAERRRLVRGRRHPRRRGGRDRPA